MVRSFPYSRESMLAQSQKSGPTLRYTKEETLTGTLGVKSKLFGSRRRLVRLERGMLYIHNNGDDCGEPIAKTRVCEAMDIVVNESRAMIHIPTSPKVGVTLVFRHDVSLLRVWAAALRRAHRGKVENFYKVCAQIGSGHYSKVFEAVDRRTGEKVAVKQVSKINEDPKVVQYARREAEIARSVKHENIVETIDVFETSNTLYIVMEYVDGGTLLHFLAGGKNRVNEKNALRFARQLFRAIAYLHGENIIHRDVKPENILVTAQGKIRLADFGLARILDGVCSDEYCLSSILGTPAYCSPEVVTKSQYGKPVDLFGCGVLLYIALSGALPFRGSTPEEVFQSIAKGKVEFPKTRWSLVSREARDLVQRLLQYNPSNRPTAEEALRHAWLASGSIRSSDERPISPRPFIRNTSARSARFGAKPQYEGMHRVTSTSSFRRAQSGSLRQLSGDRHRKGDAIYAH